MAPIIAIILGKLLDYVAAHSDEIVDAIKNKFHIAKTDPEVQAAVQEFGYEPNEKSLDNLHGVLKAKGEDSEQLATLLINQATV